MLFLCYLLFIGVKREKIRVVLLNVIEKQTEKKEKKFSSHSLFSFYPVLLETSFSFLPVFDLLPKIRIIGVSENLENKTEYSRARLSFLKIY